jgi:predicted MPP superfamily phosphohydrolase
LNIIITLFYFSILFLSLSQSLSVTLTGSHPKYKFHAWVSCQQQKKIVSISFFHSHWFKLDIQNTNSIHELVASNKKNDFFHPFGRVTGCEQQNKNKIKNKITNKIGC